VPYLGKLLKFADQPRMSNVARTQHRIDILARKPAKHLLQLRRRIRLAADMYVAHHAKRQARHRTRRSKRAICAKR